MNEERFDYLSDEELNNLIEDTENNAMFTAPPDLMADVLSRLDNEAVTQDSDESDAGRSEPKADKVKEFRSFCIKVVAAVAAAVAIIAVVPIVSPKLISEHDTEYGIEYAKDDTYIPSKEEVLGTEKPIPSKEEVLGRNRITEAIVDSHYISDLYSKRS
ncbi:MAG: hypothetical protein K5868_01035 [Lachnospiraceae bacterium]|nr:hypothetical protein [Lachnospiraceae bacterium]